MKRWPKSGIPYYVTALLIAVIALCLVEGFFR